MKATDIFQFDKNIPPELLPRIIALVTPLRVLVPKWCQEVKISYCAFPDDEDVNERTAMTAEVDYQYRRGDIFFYPALFVLPPNEQKDYCIHEFVHLSNEIVIDYARRELKRLLPDGKYRSSVMDEFATRLESATQDMCWIVRGLMNG